ncbi:MAG: hypothetical protein J6S74_03680 [Alphaproteobacteria bacterium]|nr:hypothetical protein [Alphaproteobacteria bacterium]
MKKQIALMVSAVALASVMPAYSATNSGTRAGSSANLSAAPATRTRQNVDYAKYQTRSNTATYTKQDGKNIYYTQPSNRSEMYKQYASGSSETVRTSRSETVRTELKRKYFLAHPFYQPLEGKFGSVTDLAYNTSSYDLTLNQTVPTPLTGLYELTGTKGTWHANQFAIKEDLSYGITNRIAIMGMLRYEVNENKFDWKSDPDDKQTDNGLNLFGLGAQFRIVDTADWIAELSAYFQHQKDVANNYIAELKAGYKVARSTIYGLVRGQYLDIDGDAYGNGVEGDTSALFVAYNVDNKAFYIEGGLGVFSVLDEDWTLNVEGIFGHYDWHDQFSIKGEIGWQPNDWFALGLYARASLYDSANGMKRELYWNEPAVGFNGFTEMGKAELENNQEMSVGLRAIFQF